MAMQPAYCKGTIKNGRLAGKPCGKFLGQLTAPFRLPCPKCGTWNTDNGPDVRVQASTQIAAQETPAIPLLACRSCRRTWTPKSTMLPDTMSPANWLPHPAGEGDGRKPVKDGFGLRCPDCETWLSANGNRGGKLWTTEGLWLADWPGEPGSGGVCAPQSTHRTICPR